MERYGVYILMNFSKVGPYDCSVRAFTNQQQILSGKIILPFNRIKE